MYVFTSLGLRSYIFKERKSGPPMERVGGLLGPSPNINFMSSNGACHLTNLQRVQKCYSETFWNYDQCYSRSEKYVISSIPL